MADGFELNQDDINKLLDKAAAARAKETNGAEADPKDNSSPKVADEENPEQQKPEGQLPTDFEKKADSIFEEYFEGADKSITESLEEFDARAEKEKRRLQSIVEKSDSGTLPLADKILEGMKADVQKGMDSKKVVKMAITMLCAQIATIDEAKKAVTKELKDYAKYVSFKDLDAHLEELRLVLGYQFKDHTFEMKAKRALEKRKQKDPKAKKLNYDEIKKALANTQQTGKIAAAYVAPEVLGIAFELAMNEGNARDRMVDIVDTIRNTLRPKLADVGMSAEDMPENLSYDDANEAQMSGAKIIGFFNKYVQAVESKIKEREKKIQSFEKKNLDQRLKEHDTDAQMDAFEAMMDRIFPELDRLYENNSYYAQEEDQLKKFGKGLSLLIKKVGVLGNENSKLKDLARNVNTYRGVKQIIEDYIVEFGKNVTETDSAKILVEGAQMMLDDLRAYAQDKGVVIEHIREIPAQVEYTEPVEIEDAEVEDRTLDLGRFETFYSANKDNLLTLVGSLKCEDAANLCRANHVGKEMKYFCKLQSMAFQVLHETTPGDSEKKALYFDLSFAFGKVANELGYYVDEPDKLYEAMQMLGEHVLN
ncbi:hypothetical protein KY312_02605 [Candidatus Woesearchaeota archaeon]|nr:hypothetical protein [Candidatus Woesearchaeota archaeon]